MIKTLKPALVAMVLLGAAAWATSFGAPAEDHGLAPDVWINEGDSDGDGLADPFEIRHGLDPHKAATYADGKADEDRTDPSGRSMFDVQKAEQAAAAGAGDDGGGSANCGLMGAELALLLALAALRRRI